MLLPAPPRKLLVSDLDGTLIFQRRIAPEVVAAMECWRGAGYLAVCATGKSIAATQRALQPSGIAFDFYVLYTGAVITDANYTILNSATLPSDVVLDVVRALADVPGVGVFATTLDTPDLRLASTLPAASTTDIVQHFEPLALSDVAKHKFVGIPLWIDAGADTEATIAKIQQWVITRYGALVDCHRNQNFLDIVPPGCTKRSGIEWLVSHISGEHGDEFETYSLGDSWNDLDMHAWADHSVSFPHSPAEVQAATDIVANSAADYIRKVLAQ